MFTMLRAHFDARRLLRKLRRSLGDSAEKWKVSADDAGHPLLSHGEFAIELAPRTARVFDAVHVYREDAEIWMPLMTRLQVRAAARERLLRDANERWTGGRSSSSMGGRRRKSS
jgi:hypothetical protein